MEKTDSLCHDTDTVRAARPSDQVDGREPRPGIRYLSAAIILAVCALATTLAAIDFLRARGIEPIFPSSALTRTGMLSDYFDGIRGTAGDTRIYFFESGVPGATVLLLGGTHPNEPASTVAATLIAENVQVSAGRVLVIPHACASGFTCTDPIEGYPATFTVQGNSGPRTFRMGSRVCNPLDQWPDPLVYTHYPSGQQLSGFESRNLNRSYPGRPDGSFSEKVGYAIMQLIQTESVDVAFDLHEAAPEIPIINAIVYHEKGEDVALAAVMALEMADLHYSPELSPANFHGLSHREWGDNTNVTPFLMETSNPIQGRLRGKTDEALIIDGVSERYLQALHSGALRIVYDADGEPLKRRVGRHIEGFKAILAAYDELTPDKHVDISGLPTYQEIMASGVGAYLH